MHVLSTCMYNPDLHWSWWNSYFVSVFLHSIIFWTFSLSFIAHDSLLFGVFRKANHKFNNRKTKITIKQHISHNKKHANCIQYAARAFEPIIHSHAFLILFFLFWCFFLLASLLSSLKTMMCLLVLPILLLLLLLLLLSFIWVIFRQWYYMHRKMYDDCAWMLFASRLLPFLLNYSSYQPVSSVHM